MKRKKSSKADLENKKPIFFLIGLTLSLGLVLMAFSWQTQPINSKITGIKHVFTEVDYIVQPVREKKEEIKPKIIQAEIINIIDNDIQVNDNPEIFVSDIDNEPIYDIPAALAKPKTEEPIDEEPLLIAEFMPEFPGGQQSLIRYLTENVKYPSLAQENEIEGKVYVSFVISENGEILNATVIRGVDPLLDAEALRVINQMPRWKPGRQGAKAVKVRYSVPIFFELR